jgi:phosphoribosylamine--glycine ligase
VVALPPARDYKRLETGDAGPNTGGMGCYSPVPDLPAGLIEDAVDGIIRPTLHELGTRGVHYRGFLYAGLVITSEGVKVLEFNCRLGDPEAQVVLPRLDFDLAEALVAAVEGGLGSVTPMVRPDAAVDVVLAGEGYPERPAAGAPIAGLPAAEAVADVLVFHAGTRRENGALVTSGGRVLNVVGLGPDLASARERAYRAVSTIDFRGMQYRADIAGVPG